MMEIVAAALIAVGIFLLIRGLTENLTTNEEYYNRRNRYKLEEEWDEELEELSSKEKVKRKTKFGGVVLIGPIPIVFGNSKYAFYALILTIILMLISIFLMFSFYSF